MPNPLAQPSYRRNYPTKEEILAKEIKYKSGTKKILSEWKETIWKKVRGSENVMEKFDAIKQLIEVLGARYEKPCLVRYCERCPSCCYSPYTNTIYINKTVSIISTLHEFAHHLYGSSELKACRWSVHLFKQVFEKSFNRLKWQEHMLVKQ